MALKMENDLDKNFYIVLVLRYTGCGNITSVKQQIITLISHII